MCCCGFRAGRLAGHTCCASLVRESRPCSRVDDLQYAVCVQVQPAALHAPQHLGVRGIRTVIRHRLRLPAAAVQLAGLGAHRACACAADWRPLMERHRWDANNLKASFSRDLSASVLYEIVCSLSQRTARPQLALFATDAVAMRAETRAAGLQTLQAGRWPRKRCPQAQQQRAWCGAWCRLMASLLSSCIGSATMTSPSSPRLQSLHFAVDQMSGRGSRARTHQALQHLAAFSVQPTISKNVSWGSPWTLL